MLPPKSPNHSFCRVIFEDFTKDQVSSSLFRGKFSATNLCIRREFLDEVLYPLTCHSASCKSVEIDLPVGSLESMPLRITFGRVFINLSCSPHSSPPASNFLKKLKFGETDHKSDKKDKDKDKGSWSKAVRILCGILLEIDLIEIRVNVGTLSLRMCLRDLVLQSTSADWSPVARSGLLAQCFDDSTVPGQVKFFKVLQTSSLQLQIISLETGHCSTIVDVAFKASIGISLLKDNLRPTELHLDANLSRFTVSLNNQQIERLYAAAFDFSRLFPRVIATRPAGSDNVASGDEALLPMKTSFQWQQPTEEALQSIEAFFREEGGVKLLTHNFRKFPNSFTGTQFVTWLVTPNPKAALGAVQSMNVTSFATSRQHAAFIGHCLMKSLRLKQVDNEPNFLDESVLYQFASDVPGEKSQQEHATDASPSIAFPHMKLSFSFCKTEVIIGSRFVFRSVALDKLTSASFLCHFLCNIICFNHSTALLPPLPSCQQRLKHCL
jgi:hypothetical protein